jgi:DNA-binding transcriptional MerR regulator
MDAKLVREKGCADALSVSVRTLRYWRRRKIIPFFKVGALVMYDLDEVLQALRAYKREAKSQPVTAK